MGVVPAGKMEDHSRSGFAGFGGTEMGGESVDVTLRSGYVYLRAHNDERISFIPALAGLKLSTSDRGVYIAGEAGAIFARSTRENLISGTSVSRQTNPGWSVGFGSNPGLFDLRVLFQVWDARRMQENMSLGVMLGVVLR